MSAIVSFFKTALNAGINHDMGRVKKRQVKLVNIVSIISILSTIPFIIIYTTSTDDGYVINGVISIIALIIFSANIFFNYHEQYYIAKFALIQYTAFAILIGCLVISPTLNLSIFFISTMAQTWMLCSIKYERWTLLFHNVVILIYFILAERFYFLSDYFIEYRPNLSTGQIDELNFIIIINFIILISGILGFLTWEYETNDEELKKALDTSQGLLKEKEAANINKELTNKELKRSLNELEQLAYASSHDLKMPLRGIISFSQLLKRRYSNQLDKDANEYLDYIVKEGKRQFEQIEGLLNYLRTDQKEKDIQIIETDLIVDNILLSLKGVIHDKNILVYKKNLPQMKCDANDFEQVIYNIISNAFKFTPPTRQPVIHIDCQKEGEYYKFSVEDNGLGFDMQYHDQMFGIFKTLSSEDRQKGSGIGLSICKKIILHYGGKIWAEAIINKGTTFYFTFPIQ
jgi:signal transduction histidine kinase